MSVHASATLISLLLVATCVVIHYEVLVQLQRLGRQLRRHRWLILVTVHGLLLAHLFEIWVFSLGYYAAERLWDLGAVVIEREDWLDYVYFSAMVYTTVGFGDLVPTGPLRLITIAEAVAGLSLITWSASFTFLQMQRIWRP